MTRALLFLPAALLAFIPIIHAGGPLCEKRELPDGKTEIILENQFFRAVADPQSGGTIKSLKHRGVELTSGSGILHDLMHDQSMSGSDYHLNPYMFEIKKTGDEATAHLWRRGERNNYRFLEIHKYITVSGDSSGLLVKYEFRVLPEACAPIMISPWFHNFAGAAGRNCYFVPSADGIKMMPYNPETPGKDVWTDNPSRGWTGVANAAGAGLVFSAEYSRISAFYNWFGDAGATAEWRFFPLTVKHGETFSTSLRIQPFQGLTGINGAGSGIAGQVETRPGDTAGITLVSTDKRTVRLEAELIFDGGKSPVRLQWQKTVALETDKPFSTEAQAPGLKDAAAIRIIIKDNGGKFLADLLSPARGGADAKFSFAPLEERIRPSGEDFEWRFKPDFSVVTPHFNFAKPFAGGKMKVLFMLETSAAREAAEISQRADITPEYYPVVPSSEFYPFWVGPEEGKSIPQGRKARVIHEKSMAEMAAAVKESGAKVFVLGDNYNDKYQSKETPWTALPEAARKELVERVRNGAGLVYVNPSKLDGEMLEAFNSAPGKAAAEDITAFTPARAFSEKDRSQIKAVSLGKGRVVFMKYRAQGILPYIKPFTLDFTAEEPLYSMFCRALLWAGGAEPSVKIAVSGEESGSLDISVPDARARGIVSAQITVWTGRRETELKETRKIENSPLKIDLRGRLPRGDHFALVRLLDSKGDVVDWRMIPFKVSHDTKITGVTLGASPLTKGKPEKLEIRLESKRGDGPLALDIECKDVFGRLLFKSLAELEAGDGPRSVTREIKIDNPITVLHRLTATLRGADRVFDRKETDVTVSDAGDKKYHRALIWGNYGGYPNHLYQHVMDILRGAGFDTVAEGTVWDVSRHCNYPPAAGLRLAHTNLNRVVISDTKPITQYQRTLDKELLKRNPCLNDPAYRQKIKEKLQDTTAATLKYSPEIYMLGDEMSLTTEGGDIPFDVCFSDSTMAAFREWLKQKYGTLEKLGAAWKIPVQSWESALPLTLEEALKERKFASWLDHRSFMDSVYAEWFNYSGSCVREINPRARVGESGIEPKISAYGGYDWSKRMAYEDTACFYGYGDMPISFADRKRKTLGRWVLGYLRPEAAQQYEAWRCLFHGQNMTACWFTGLVAQPDLTLSPWGKVMKPLISEITDGPGEILSAADYIYSPVAILYSQESCQAALLLKHSTAFDYYKEYSDNLEAWNQNLRSAGYTPRFVSAAMIKSGALQSGGIKALILPCALMMDTETATAVESFVKSGGLLIADVQTGVLDGAGERRKEGVLDKLLHVKRAADSSLKSSPAKYAVKGGTISSGVQEDISPDGDGVTVLAAADGGVLEFGGMRISAKDAAPSSAVIESKTGKGSAVSLGATRWNFLSDGGNFLADMLRRHGLKPELLITDEKGIPLNAEAGHFRCGDIDYHGVILLPENDKTDDASMAGLEAVKKDARIKFPAAGELCEMRTHESFGKTDEISVRLSPGIARLYASLPQKAVWSVSGPGKIKAGEAWKFNVSSNISELPLSVTAKDPDGRNVSCLKKFVFARKGDSEGLLPFALNDKKGVWTIVFKDAVTASEKEMKVQIE